MRYAPPRIDDPGYVAVAARALRARTASAPSLPLTDLDIEVLAQARADGLLPALVPAPEIARATYDKYETHLLLRAPRPAVAADRAARGDDSTRSTIR